MSRKGGEAVQRQQGHPCISIPRGWLPFMGVAYTLFSGAILLGCGSDHSASDPPAKRNLGPHAAYFRQVKVAAAPLVMSRAAKAMNEAGKAEQLGRMASTTEAFLSELRAYVRRLEAIHPPPPCAAFHKDLERVERVSIQIFAEALPLYRRKERGLLKIHERRAQRRLQAVRAPLRPFEGTKKLPC